MKKIIIFFRFNIEIIFIIDVFNRNIFRKIKMIIKVLLFTSELINNRNFIVISLLKMKNNAIIFLKWQNT